MFNTKLKRQEMEEVMSIKDWQKAILNYKKQVSKAISDLNALLMEKRGFNDEKVILGIEKDLADLNKYYSELEEMELNLDKIITDEEVNNISSFVAEVRDIFANEFREITNPQNIHDDVIIKE